MKAFSGARWWAVLVAACVVLLGVGVAFYVSHATAQIREALAEEVLEQQSDVAALIHDYNGLLLAVEQERRDPGPERRARLQQALEDANLQLLRMRSTYSFERLDGAAKAHAFVKPILEDVGQWLAQGLPGVARDDATVLAVVEQRLSDRYTRLRQISAETDNVAISLIADQSEYLGSFRRSLIFLLAAYALMTMGIGALLLRQRNLSSRLAHEQEQHAQRFRDFADIGADWLWETDAEHRLRGPAGRPSEAAFSGGGSPDSDMRWPLEIMSERKSFGNLEVQWGDDASDLRVMSLSAKPLFSADGQFQGYRGVGRDITGRKRMEAELEDTNRLVIQAETRGREQAEAALRESEVFLRTTLDALPAQIAILDQQGRVIAANLAWTDFAKAGDANDNGDGLGRHYLEVFADAESQERQRIASISTEIHDVLKGRRDALRHEYPHHVDGARQWTVVNLTTFNVSEDHYAVLIREDITQRRQLEERDRRLRSELAHATRLTTVGEMASGLAHELNQPLTAISHNCDALVSVLQDQIDTDDELLDMTRDIYEQAQLAGGIIRSLRRLMRKDTMRTDAVELNQLVEETVRLTYPEAREQGVNVELSLAERLPRLEMDPVQIQQVLVNLERNGVEAIGNSSDAARNLKISTVLEDENLIRVSVRDSGPGFAPSIRERLFSPFQSTKKDGMGLGLSISRSIVESHGGRLWLDADDSAGTTLHFTLPISRE